MLLRPILEHEPVFGSLRGYVNEMADTRSDERADASVNRTDALFVCMSVDNGRKRPSESTLSTKAAAIVSTL